MREGAWIREGLERFRRTPDSAQLVSVISEVPFAHRPFYMCRGTRGKMKQR